MCISAIPPRSQAPRYPHSSMMKWLGKVNEKEKFGIKTTEAPHYRRVILQEKQNFIDNPKDSIGRSIGITAGKGFMFVSHTGEVYPSGFLPESGGNIKNGKITNIYKNSDLFCSLRDSDKLKGKCGVCKFKHICGGSRSRAYAYTNDPLKSDPLCKYIPTGYTGETPKQEFNIKE